MFRLLDTDNDGKLSRADVRKSYKDLFDQDMSDDEITAMFRQVNFGGEGEAIEYSEFVVASLTEKDMIDERKISAAFKIFDKGDKGFISVDDLVRVLGLQNKDDEWSKDYVVNKIIKQVDVTGSGEIDFEEFTAMMIIDDEVDMIFDGNNSFGTMLHMYQDISIIDELDQ